MNGNVNASRQRLTLSNLTEPQQMRELNRQLEWIWAQLMGGLSRKSLSSGLQSVIDGKADGETVTSLSTRIEQAEDEIALKASSETVNALGERVSTAETSITQNATAISSKASQNDFDALGERVATAESEIKQTPNKITAAVNGVEIGGTNLLYCSADMGYSNSRGFQFNSAGADTVGTAGEAGSDGSRLVTNTNSNLRFYHTRLAVTAGETFTISAEYKIVSGSPDIRLQLSFYKTATDWTSAGAFADTGTETALGDGWVRRSFTATAPAGSVTLMPFWSSGADNASFTHSYYIRHPKLERGNKATGWRQNPEELRIGSSVLMDEQHVEINAPYLDINVSGTAGDLHIDEDGISAGTATFETLNCPGVVKHYTGAASITLAAGSDVSAISNALSNHMLTYDVTITLTGDVNGALILKGLCGSGNVTIKGAGHTLNGYALLSNNGCRINVESLKISKTTANRQCVNADRCVEAKFYSCIFNANNAPSNAQGIRTSYSSVFLQNCEFYNIPDSAMAFSYGTDALVLGCKGAATYCFWYDGATLRVAGSRPSGLCAGGNPSFLMPADPSTITVNTGSATPTETPVTTARYTASVTGTYYPSGHWIGNSSLIQGRYDTTRYYACMWFNAGALAGKTIRSATLTIKRIAGAGKSSSVNVTLFTSPVTGKSGNPTTNAVSLGTLGKAGNGETVIVNLPTSAIAAIAAGGALMLDPGDTANASNKRYSANYARFEGKDDGTPPVLTVTYQ